MGWGGTFWSSYIQPKHLDHVREYEKKVSNEGWCIWFVSKRMKESWRLHTETPFLSYPDKHPHNPTHENLWRRDENPTHENLSLVKIYVMTRKTYPNVWQTCSLRARVSRARGATTQEIQLQMRDTIEIYHKDHFEEYENLCRSRIFVIWRLILRGVGQGKWRCYKTTDRLHAMKERGRKTLQMWEY